jgi:hypothetical protein
MPSQIDLIKALVNRATFAPSSEARPFDIADEALRTGVEWYGLMKAITRATKMRDREAHKNILSHRGWHRIIEAKLHSDPRCRKEAYRFCRSHRDNGLITKEGDRYTILIQPTR